RPAQCQRDRPQPTCLPGPPIHMDDRRPAGPQRWPALHPGGRAGVDRPVAAAPVGLGRGHAAAYGAPLMPFDEALADRVRSLVAGEAGLTEKRMFGGLALLLDGRMAVVIRGKGGLMVRVEPGSLAKALGEPGASEAVMRGRPMTGWVIVEPSSVDKAP